MTVALGKKMFGAVLAVAGFNILLDKHQAPDVIVGALVFAAGAAMFAWGFRK
jgi:hypothetical protein